MSEPTTANGKLFLQLMEKAPPHVQLATLCLLCIGAEGKSAEDRQEFIRLFQMDERSKGEYKRAIKHLRECQSADDGRQRAFYEAGISFIRQLMTARLFRKLNPDQQQEVNALIDQLYTKEQEAAAV